MDVADRQGEGVGGVEGDAGALAGQQRKDHGPDLLLFGLAVADQRLLDEARLVLEDGDGRAGGGGEQDAAGVGELERRGDVFGGEDGLDRDGRRTDLGRGARAAAANRKSSLAGSSMRAGGRQTPQLSSRRRPLSKATIPKPVATVPGSSPRMITRLAGVFREVEVRPDVLHVVVVLDRLHQLHHLVGLARVEGDLGRRDHRDLGDGERQALRLELRLDRRRTLSGAVLISWYWSVVPTSSAPASMAASMTASSLALSFSMAM